MKGVIARPKTFDPGGPPWWLWSWCLWSWCLWSWWWWSWCFPWWLEASATATKHRNTATVFIIIYPLCCKWWFMMIHSIDRRKKMKWKSDIRRISNFVYIGHLFILMVLMVRSLIYCHLYRIYDLTDENFGLKRYPRFTGQYTKHHSLQEQNGIISNLATLVEAIISVIDTDPGLFDRPDHWLCQFLWGMRKI